MAKLNYRGMVNESEIFSRITRGFNKVICESFVKEDGEQEGAAPEGETQGTDAGGADAGAAPAEGGTEGATDDAEAVANATPEQVNGSVTEAKKPMKKLIPEGCCGGKAKKVLKEGALGSAIGGAAGAVLGGVVGHPVVGAGIGAACGHSLTEGAPAVGKKIMVNEDAKKCPKCGGDLDENGKCPACDKELKEGEDEITLQVPGSIKRQNALKKGAAENKAKVGQVIRDGKASFALKEGEGDRLFGTFTIEIETGNAAFGENADDTVAEIRAIIEKKLDDIASVVKDGGCVKLLDTNGNSVGTMCFKTEE